MAGMGRQAVCSKPGAAVAGRWNGCGVLRHRKCPAQAAARGSGGGRPSGGPEALSSTKRQRRGGGGKCRCGMQTRTPGGRLRLRNGAWRHEAAASNKINSQTGGANINKVGCGSQRMYRNEGS